MERLKKNLRFILEISDDCVPFTGQTVVVKPLRNGKSARSEKGYALVKEIAVRGSVYPILRREKSAEEGGKL